MGGPPSRRFLCLFWRETRQRVFGLEISACPEVVTGRKKRVGWEKELTAVGEGIRTDAVDSGHSSRENRVQRIKMTAFQLLCGIFASNPC